MMWIWVIFNAHGMFPHMKKRKPAIVPAPGNKVNANSFWGNFHELLSSQFIEEFHLIGVHFPRYAELVNVAKQHGAQADCSSCATILLVLR